MKKAAFVRSLHDPARHVYMDIVRALRAESFRDSIIHTNKMAIIMDNVEMTWPSGRHG